mgnify:CR=1 FL=1
MRVFPFVKHSPVVGSDNKGEVVVGKLLFQGVKGVDGIGGARKLKLKRRGDGILHAASHHFRHSEAVEIELGVLIFVFKRALGRNHEPYLVDIAFFRDI